MRALMRASLLSAGAFLAVGVFGACVGQTPETTPTKAVTSAGVSSSAGEIASASAPSSAPPAPPPFPQSPLHVVTHYSGHERLFKPIRAGSTVLVLAQGADGQGTIIGEAKGPNVTFSATMSKGIDPNQDFSDIQLLGGTWPENAFASLSKPSGRTGFSEIYHWEKDQWKNTENSPEGYMANGFFPWVGGSTLVIKLHGMMSDTQIEVRGGQKSGPAPKPAKPAKLPPGTFGCKSSVRASAMAATPNGYLFIAGNPCDPSLFKNATSGLVVERWVPNKQESVIDSISAPTDVDYSAESFTVLSGNEAYLLVTKSTKNKIDGRLILAFDGTNWSPLSLPTDVSPNVISATTDGTIWLGSTHGQIWKKPRGDKWAQVFLPPDIMAKHSPSPANGDSAAAKPRTFPIELTAVGNDDVWFEVKMPSGKAFETYILHTQTPSKELVWPKSDESKKAAARLSAATAPSPKCTTPFVLLYTLSKVAPADYDYPATRKALKGHTEFGDVKFIEFQRGNQRFFGARFPDQDGFDRAKKLASIVQQGVPGSSPQVVCHDPEQTRVLKIDLSTGNLAP